MAERDALVAVLQGGEWGGFPMPNRAAERFGAAFARFHDARHGLCVANGTVALEVGLQAIGVEARSEVVVPAYTFEATAAAVLFSGCVPVFADVDAETYCLDPDSVEEVLTERTAAIVPVQLAMGFADMDRLTEIAGREGLRVLEDCAHAHGAQWRGRGAGSIGDAGAFSFQTSKLMTAGEGGAVVTSDDRVLDRLFALVNCGRQRPGRERDHVVVGHNYRLSDLQAAVLEVQLERLEEQHRRRNTNVDRLITALDGLAAIEPVTTDTRVTRRAVYQFVLRYRPLALDGLPRAAFVAALAAEGVPCDGNFYESLTTSELLAPDAARYPAFAARPQIACPRAERAAYEEAIWLPHELFLGDAADVDDISAALRKVCEHHSELHELSHPAIDEQTVVRTAR
ncbi:MAG: DegT/DnrJ/EryC1/StrS family aminotransferase [Acidobacteriota bacterium]|nr:DegT/DnrJ/EryC1/StrS family aminotransferase [Acidobacteriota bacterium]